MVGRQARRSRSEAGTDAGPAIQGPAPSQVSSSDDDHDLEGRIASARWHTLRYDALRASLASRATFVVSVNAIVVAGTSLLFNQARPVDLAGGRVAFAVASVGAAVTLLYSVLSVARAIGVLAERRHWRTLFGDDPPSIAFYQHTDTFRRLSTYQAFEAEFKGQSREDELQSAVANLWVIMRMHQHRYGYLRRAVRHLGTSMTIFVFSVMLILALRLTRQFVW